MSDKIRIQPNAEGARAKTQAKKQAAEEPEPEVYEVVDAPTKWGPYAEYTFVQTEYGEYAVPAHTIMEIELRPTWSRKEGREIMRPYPTYTPVRTNDPRLKPVQDRTLEEREAAVRRREERAAAQKV